MRSLFFLLMLTGVASGANEVQPEVDVAFRQMLHATIHNNYDQFIAGTDSSIKTTLKPRDLLEVSLKIRPRADKGYRVEYLGYYNVSGHTTHLWKVVFDDGGDDVLATMSQKDGRISGFYLK